MKRVWNFLIGLCLISIIFTFSIAVGIFHPMARGVIISQHRTARDGCSSAADEKCKKSMFFVVVIHADKVVKELFFESQPEIWDMPAGTDISFVGISKEPWGKEISAWYSSQYVPDTTVQAPTSTPYLP